MDRERWYDLLRPFYGLGHVLDHIIRHSTVPAQIVVVEDVSMDVADPDAATPVTTSVHSFAVGPVDSGSVGDLDPTPCTVLCTAPCTEHVDPFSVEPFTPCLSILQIHQTAFGLIPCQAPPELLSCKVFWLDNPSVFTVIDVAPVTSLACLVHAESKLYGRVVLHVTDDFGKALPLGAPVPPGQTVVLWPDANDKQLHPVQAGVSPIEVDECCVAPQVPAQCDLNDPGLRMHDVSVPMHTAHRAIAPADAIQPAEVFVEPLVEPTMSWSKYPLSQLPIVAADTLPYGIGSSPCDIQPLMQLSNLQLLHISMPNIQTLDQWNAIQSQLIRSGDRLSVLRNQGPLYADDEMRFHIQELVLAANQQILAQSHQGFTMTIDPLLMTAWIPLLTNHCRDFLNQVGAHMKDKVKVVTAVNLHGHWIPLHFERHGSVLKVLTWDDSAHSHSDLNPLLHVVMTSFHCDTIEYVCMPRFFAFENGCGVLAIAFLAHVVSAAPLPAVADEAASIHTKLKTRFGIHLASLEFCPRPWTWAAGPSEATHQSLTALLSQHGVPSELAPNRATLAIKTLGVGAVEIALNHKNPWKQLKTVGNQHRFQFLLPNELQALIDKNKQNAVGKKQKPNKLPKKKGPPPAVSLDPAKLAIVDGTFRCDGNVIPQIQLCQLGPAATGVILANVDDAMPYLRSSTKVSTEPLAILVLGDTAQVMCTLNQSQVVVPCTCLANKEPILVEASLYQIGSKDVIKHTHANPVTLPSIDVVTMKFVLFRDEITEDWREICKAPIRFLVSQVPCLRLCTTMDCTCPAWHDVENVGVPDPVLDVWRRQYLQFGFNQCRPQDADMYSACLRLPACLTDRLLRSSGSQGIYVEPRSHDGKFIAEEFSVVWAPKLSKAELVHVRQTHPCALGLARLGERRGIRTRPQDAEKIHAVVRPNTMYLPSGPKLQFLAGPFPFGASRQAISDAFGKLKWTAKAIQPMNPVQATQTKGNMWLMHSADAPPESVFQMGHGEVVVTVHKSPQQNAQAAPAKPVATKATLDLCGTKAKPNEDVLQTHDPWKSWKATEWQAPASQLPNAADALSQFESRLEKSIMSKIQQAPQDMVQDDLPDRMQELEAKMQSIATRQQTMEQNLADSTATHATQLHQLQHQITCQSQQLNGKIEHQQQNIQAMFESQLSQIRSLLNKRNHPDGNE